MTAQERDCLVAEKITMHGYDGVPTQLIGCAWQVVDKMREKGLQLQLFGPITDGHWIARFVDHSNGRLFVASAIDAPQAICPAALRAVGVDV